MTTCVAAKEGIGVVSARMLLLGGPVSSPIFKSKRDQQDGNLAPAVMGKEPTQPGGFLGSATYSFGRLRPLLDSDDGDDLFHGDNHLPLKLEGRLSLKDDDIQLWGQRIVDVWALC